MLDLAHLPENLMTRFPLALLCRSRLGRARGAALLAALLMSMASLADDSTSAAGEPGTWQNHHYTFQFLGFTTTYSCDGLADKLRMLLLAAGARSDVKSQAGACAAGFGRPDKFARADLNFYTLAPADAGAAGALSGVWRPVTFGYHSPRDLERGDCELVEQFRTQLLPMFTTRNVTGTTTCIPFQDSGSNIDLRFEALTAPPAKKPPGVDSDAPGTGLIVYPKNGQTEVQIAKDKFECHQWAVGQTGYDPTANAPAAASKRIDYMRAQVACLNGRGYSVN
jgi:hypothetical protein